MKRRGYQISPGKGDGIYRNARTCGRMCKDYGALKRLFTFKDGPGDCQCQEQVDDISECNAGDKVNLYRYSGEQKGNPFDSN